MSPCSRRLRRPRRDAAFSDLAATCLVLVLSVAGLAYVVQSGAWQDSEPADGPDGAFEVRVDAWAGADRVWLTHAGGASWARVALRVLVVAEGELVFDGLLGDAEGDGRWKAGDRAHVGPLDGALVEDAALRVSLLDGGDGAPVAAGASRVHAAAPSTATDLPREPCAPGEGGGSCATP